MCSRLGFPCEHGIPTAEYLYRMRCAFQQASILLLHSLKSIKRLVFMLMILFTKVLNVLKCLIFSLENICMLCVKRINGSVMMYVIENI